MHMCLLKLYKVKLNILNVLNNPHSLLLRSLKCQIEIQAQVSIIALIWGGTYLILKLKQISKACVKENIINPKYLKFILIKMR